MNVGVCVCVCVYGCEGRLEGHVCTLYVGKTGNWLLKYQSTVPFSSRWWYFGCYCGLMGLFAYVFVEIV